MQYGFSTLWDGFATDKDALQARNKMAKEYRKQGRRVKCFAMRNQIRKYSGLGESDGGCCTVYLVDVN